jgi:superfamily I DNA/RNA helicase
MVYKKYTKAPMVKAQPVRIDFAPTAQQSDICAAFQRKENMIIKAGAGAAKTSTLVMMANDALDRKGRFLAFNKAIVTAAEAKMPKNVKCSTFHGYFYGICGRNYANRSSAVSARKTADILGINSDIELSDRKLTPIMQSRSVYGAINKFSMSDDKEISGWHIPYIRGLSTDDMNIVRAELSTYLQPAWQDIADVRGQLRFKPENYIKIGALSSPRIAASFVMIDEAQDTFPVILGWLKRQYHLQMCVVGDPAQAINGWTGAVDAMDKFGPKFIEYTLDQSFRFGPAIADEANKILSLLGDFRIKGFDKVESEVTDNLDSPHAILCRTNAGVIDAAMRSVDAGNETAMPDAQVKEIRAIAQAAMQLMAGSSCDFAEFNGFNNWQEVQEYVTNDPSGADLKTTVTIIDKYGAAALVTLADSLVSMNVARTIVSTVHKTKGLEWSTVEISDDFPEPKPNSDGTKGEITKDEAMLYYVAITRAKNVLNMSGLDWTAEYTEGDDTEE